MATTNGATRIAPRNLPWPAGSTNLTAIEWTQEIIESHADFTFRSVFAFPIPHNGADYKFVTHTPNNRPKLGTIPNDFYGAIFEFDEALGFGASAQFSGLSVPEPNGLLLEADPTIDPLWQRLWLDGDYTGVVWPYFFAAKGLYPLNPLPLKLRVFTQLIGFVTDPVGNYFRDLSGNWIPLIGDFARWRIKISINDAPFNSIGVLYMPAARIPSLRASHPFELIPENFTNHPGVPDLSYDPLQFRYSHVRVWDGTNWHELNDWRTGYLYESTDTNHGWTPQAETGKLTIIVGNTSVYREHLVPRWMFTGFQYENARTQAVLPPQGFSALASGSGGTTFDGPRWGSSPSSLPCVLHDRNRGYIVMHPSPTDGASQVYVARESGLHQFVGAFARANNIETAGDGVRCSIVSENQLLFQGEILSGSYTIDVANVFAAGPGVIDFDVSLHMNTGDRLRFIIDSRSAGDATFDLTAIKSKVFITPTESELDPMDAPVVTNQEEQIIIRLIRPDGTVVTLGVSGDTGLAFIQTKDLDFVGADASGNYTRDSIRRKSVQGIRFELNIPSSGLMTVEMFARDKLTDPLVSYGQFTVDDDGVVMMRLPNKRYYSFILSDNYSSTRWSLTAFEIFGVPAGARA